MIQLSKSQDDTEISKTVRAQWTSLGLEDVQLVNYSVLLSLPGPSPGSVTLSSRGQCFHANGRPCSGEARAHSSQDLLASYAAYSARGTLEVMWPFVSVIYSEIKSENSGFHLNWTNWQEAKYTSKHYMSSVWRCQGRKREISIAWLLTCPIWKVKTG